MTTLNNEQKVEPISKALLVLNGVVVLLIILMVFLIYTRSTYKQQVKKQSATTNLQVFDNLKIEAKAVYVFDVFRDRVLFKKNEFAQLPLASVTKLMMALTAIELVSGNSNITVKKEFLREEGDSGLLADESWRLKDLLDFSLVVSSNDGARSIASVVGAMDLETQDYNLGHKDFINKMNIKAQELGLKQTYFINESGLDVGSMSGGYGSAIDVAELLQYIIVNYPDILEATKYKNLSIPSANKIHSAKNTNIGLGDIPNLIASKTGYTSLAGGNLAVAFDSSMGRPIIVVVLGSTEQGRFSDVSALVGASLGYTEAQP